MNDLHEGDSVIKKKLMIVDDEKLICWTLSKTFTQEGYDVICFNSGEQALEGMREDPAHAMILDLRLPGMNGLDVLEAIRESHPETKILMISAYGSEDARKRAKELGVLEFFDKPLNLAELKETIAKAFEI